MTDFPYTMFGSYLLFTLCVCLTAQVTASVSYDDPNEQHSLKVKDIAISSAQGQVVNPHGDPSLCTSCHTSEKGGRDAFVNTDSISRLCQSCHDGKLASQEIHPVDVVPNVSAEMKIPSDMPLVDGKLTCLSCHDIASKCNTEEFDWDGNHSFLRQDNASRPLDFCFRCHQQQDYQTFNVHDQIEADQVKSETCLWCHISVPEVSSAGKQDASYELRSGSHGVCNNCHQMSDRHPNDELHMYSVPSEEMMWCMSAHEMMPRMRVPFKRLYKYISGAKRPPRSIPLDKDNRIACYSCHNPHEKGLFPDSNPRAVGAEAKQAKNYRLRTQQGKICKVCHYK